MPVSKVKTSTDFGLLLSSNLRQSIRKPNIHQYVPHAKQVMFDEDTHRGILFTGGNRCLSKDTLIQMSDGSIKAIQNIVVGDEVLAFDKKLLKAVPSKVLELFDNGLRDVYQFNIGRYQDTFNIECTLDHEVYGLYESHSILRDYFGPIYTLTNGKRPRHKLQRSTGTSYGISESRALMLGLMLGDGNWTGTTSSKLQFTCADLSLISETNLFIPRYGIQYGLKNHKEWFSWFDTLGLLSTYSEEKFIPSQVWGWDESSIKQLVAGFLATDGSVYCNEREEWHVNFCSNSSMLLYGIKKLLGIRLGIWGSTVTKQFRSGSGQYSITYGTAEAVSKLLQLPIPGVKGKFSGRPRFSKLNSSSSQISVRGSKFLGSFPTYDIRIDHKDHFFMLENGCFVSNSGKTTGGATKAVRLLMGIHPTLSKKYPAPVYGRAVGVNFEHGVEKIIMPEIRRWLPPTELVGDSWETAYDKTLRTLTLKNGSQLEFMSYEQLTEKFAGTSRHFIWFDEEPPRAIFDECLVRLVDTKGIWWITMTPVEGMTWVYDIIYLKGKEDDKYGVIEVNSTENPHIDEETLDELLGSMADEDQQARKEGKFLSAGGFIYEGHFKPNQHVIKRFTPPKDWLWVASLDAGYTNPSCWLWAVVDPNGRIFVIEELYQSKTIVSDLAKQVHSTNARHGRVPNYYVGDPSIRNTDPLTGTSILIEYGKHGVGILLGNNDQKAGIDKIINKLDNEKLYITENCVNLISEMKRLRWATFASKKIAYDKNKKEEQHKKDDHAPDSLRYLISSRPEYDGGINSAPVNIRALAESSAAAVPYDTGLRQEPTLDVDYYMGSEF